MAALLLAPVLAWAPAAPAGAAEGPWIDTSNRAEVLASYLAEFDRAEPALGHTGDVDSCNAGTTSPAFRDSVREPPVVTDDGLLVTSSDGSIFCD